jgi:uncharacterized protein (TIGR02246 family)
MRSLAAVTIALGFFVAACSPPVPAPPAKPDLASEEQAIRDQDARWLKAEETRDAAGAAAVFASDGVAYREHLDPIVGPTAFQAYVNKFSADNPNVKVTWSTDAIRMAESGDVAIQTGEYHLTALGPKADGEDKGRFVTIWKKINGEWKVAHDISSTTMPEVQAAKK